MPGRVVFPDGQETIRQGNPEGGTVDGRTRVVYVPRPPQPLLSPPLTYNQHRYGSEFAMNTVFRSERSWLYPTVAAFDGDGPDPNRTEGGGSQVARGHEKPHIV